MRIIGYDGVSVATRTVLNISSIRQDILRIAKSACEMLAAQMERRPIETKRVIVPVSILNGPNELSDFMDRHKEELITSPRPFADYMRMKFWEKGVLQQNVFLAADLSENYGYKLIAEEKHTRQRDTILRLCLAARFRPEEVQEALILCGMAPLHGRFPRDACWRSPFKMGSVICARSTVCWKAAGKCR